MVPLQSDKKLPSPSTRGDSSKTHKYFSWEVNAIIKVNTEFNSFIACFLSFSYVCKRNTVESCFLTSFITRGG